jgi:hypothetical protein
MYNDGVNEIILRRISGSPIIILFFKYYSEKRKSQFTPAVKKTLVNTDEINRANISRVFGS